MKKIVQTTILSVLTSFCFAAELNYKWKANSTYLIQMKATDDVSTKMGMMGMSQELKETYYTNTTLKLSIVSVDTGGTAKGFLIIDKFDITNSKNMKVAGLNAIPSQALKAEISVDKKGHFTFYKEVYILATASGNILVSGKVSGDGTSTSATATVGDQQVTVYAKFDPKTGALKAGYTEQSVSTPKQEMIKITQEDKKLDILPYDMLALLELPEGNTNTGDKAEVQSGYYKTTITTTEVNATNAKLNISLATDKSLSAAASSAKMSGGDGQNNTAIDMSNMGGLDAEMNEFNKEMNTSMETGMGGTSTTPADMMPTMTANVNYNFNLNKGMFDLLTGNITTSQNMMGFEMKTNSNVTLTMIEQPAATTITTPQRGKTKPVAKKK
jgi:hypothetical protein